MKYKIIHYAYKNKIDLDFLREKVGMGTTRFQLFIAGQIIPTTKEITITCLTLGEGRSKIFGKV